MHIERRRKRSSYKALALQYWLSSVARQNRIVALVIADTSGMLVAGSLKGPEAEELAALAPLLAREDENGNTITMRHRLPMAIAEAEIDGATYYLCAVGKSNGCDHGLGQATRGINRILSEIPQAA